MVRDVFAVLVRARATTTTTGSLIAAVVLAFEIYVHTGVTVNDKYNNNL